MVKRQRTDGSKFTKSTKVYSGYNPTVLAAKKKHMYYAKYGNKSLVTPEIKFIDNNINTNTTNNGVVQLLNGSVQGTDSTNRIGRKIQMTSFQIDLKYCQTTTNFTTLAAWPTSSCHVKWCVVFDKQTNGAAPAWTDVFDQSGSIITPFAHRNLSTLDRFDVLASDVGDISAAAANSCSWSRYCKVQLDTRYFGTNNGNVTDIDSGGLFLLVADDNANNTALGQVYGRLRVRFRDM